MTTTAEKIERATKVMKEQRELIAKLTAERDALLKAAEAVSFTWMASDDSVLQLAINDLRAEINLAQGMTQEETDAYFDARFEDRLRRAK